MESMISSVLSNFTVTAFVLGLIAAAVAVVFGPRPVTRERIVETTLAYFVFFSVGVAMLFNFVMHVFFGDMTARFIGWENSPFQAEVGFASLGFAAVAFLAFKASRGMRLLAIVGPACFLWGAAGGHVVQMVTAGNFAPGNAGSIFYTDILIPLFGFLLLALSRADAHRPSPLPTVGGVA